MHFSSQLSKHPLTLKTSPPPNSPPSKVRERWGGSGEGQGRKERVTSTVINNGSRQNQQELVKKMPSIHGYDWKPNSTTLGSLQWHKKKNKIKNKSSSQICRNTRLQLVRYYYFVKVFHLFLQGLATLLHFFFSCSATTTRGRHKAWKFPISTSLWVVRCAIPFTVVFSEPQIKLPHAISILTVSSPIRNFLYWRVLSVFAAEHLHICVCVCV